MMPMQLDMQSDAFIVMFMLENTGRCDGSEVVQVYAADLISMGTHPVKEMMAL